MTISSTMMDDYQLTLRSVFDFGRRVHAASRIITFTGDGYVDSSFAEVADRADRLAAALRRLGIGIGDRVGTFMWNNQTHMEAYLAVPCMGAILHTLNVRLFPEQLAYVINHAEDRVIIVDASIAPLLARVRDQLTTVEHIIVKGPGDATSLGSDTLDYDELLAAESGGYAYPEIAESAGAAMCYTSGTTGNPKGVMYSHRSSYLHSLVVTSTANVALAETDRLLAIVPMFHANAWGLAHAAVAVGADCVMPGPDLSGKAVADLIVDEKVTVAAGVPTIWQAVLPEMKGRPHSLRAIPCGGSAVPKGLSESYREQLGLPLLQAWGMTETSPVAALTTILGSEVHLPESEKAELRTMVGRPLYGVDARVVEPGTTDPLPWDGETSGELQCAGSWVTGTYYNDDRAAESFTADGWLRTGDVATVDRYGRIRLVDRTKDLIKSGGEWISSVEIENELMAHPKVKEAAVIGVVHAKWGERPLACVVVRPGETLTKAEVIDHLRPTLAKWQLPEDVVFIDEVPKTSVGKFSKKTLRDRFADYAWPNP